MKSGLSERIVYFCNNQTSFTCFSKKVSNTQNSSFWDKNKYIIFHFGQYKMMHPDRKVFTMLKYKRYQPTHDKLMMISDETNISIQNQDQRWWQFQVTVRPTTISIKHPVAKFCSTFFLGYFALYNMFLLINNTSLYTYNGNS